MVTSFFWANSLARLSSAKSLARLSFFCASSASLDCESMRARLASCAAPWAAPSFLRSSASSDLRPERRPFSSSLTCSTCACSCFGWPPPASPSFESGLNVESFRSLISGREALFSWRLSSLTMLRIASCVLTRAMSSRRSKGLWTQSLHCSSRPLMTALVEFFAETMMIGRSTREWLLRISARTSSPLKTGIMTSSRTMSGNAAHSFMYFRQAVPLIITITL
mmetsp:Transcript_89572/g.253737  ORF Transcript_89572/g.253737 Transcript_89572/m.253737 type:complete len:223 (+) Transcript_89572:694-1362(+)